jgi:hypothetical protein
MGAEGYQPGAAGAPHEWGPIYLMGTNGLLCRRCVCNPMLWVMCSGVRGGGGTFKVSYCCQHLQDQHSSSSSVTHSMDHAVTSHAHSWAVCALHSVTNLEVSQYVQVGNPVECTCLPGCECVVLCMSYVCQRHHAQAAHPPGLCNEACIMVLML